MKELTLNFSLVLLAILTIASCAKDEEVMTGTINGFVSDYTNANAPIAGATVTINSKGLTKTTGSDGRFEFANLEPGTYSIAVSANNYQPTTKQVTVYAGQTVNCDFQLEKAGASIEISPQTLSFGKDVEQLSFSIKNNGNSSLNYSISNAPDFIEVSPASGTVAAKATQSVSVHVKERSSITTNRAGQLTVNVGNDSYIVSINVTNNTSTDPNQGGGNNDNPNQGGTSDVSVTRGLLAYYTFDNSNCNNSYRDSNNGVLNGNGKFITDTPNGKGYSLSLDQEQYVSIPNNMLSQKTAFTISLWIKDFGSGLIFGTIDGNYYSAPSFWINNKNSLSINGNFDTNESNYSLQSIQSSGWHMVCLTFNRTSEQILLYIDGKRADSMTRTYIQSTGNRMQIGGSLGKTWADPMIVDNVRIHSVTLSEEEVQQIYNSEK